MPKSQYKIFISYAQNDVVYFNLLKDGLDNHTKHSKNLLWEVWDNTQVRPGENWHEVIQEKITGCDCVILLISSNFLYSEYIEKQEFGRFIQRQESDGLLVFPILLEPCDFTQWTYLRDRQLFIPNGSKYGLPEIEQLSYAHLVAFDKNGRVLPNPFREEYHIELVKIFEATLSEFSSKNQALSLDKKSVDNKTQQENLPLAFKAYLEKVKDFEPIDASEDELREFTNIGNQLASVFMSSFDRITKKIMDSEHLKELYLDVHFEEIAYSEKLGLITEKVIEVKFKDRNKYPYWERSQIVSALTLSLIYQFDENKVKWLLNFVRSKEDFVWKRALIGLFVGLMNNEKHIKGYLQQELNQLKSDYE
ncbi:MAG: toll/interleukin-1 receptor domain-containing protein, partial [Saprospiraceae bacterium]|nr:toll/interleukin-1 receptor domain-containing protein [Saprospiraceae bacterium]